MAEVAELPEVRRGLSSLHPRLALGSGAGGDILKGQGGSLPHPKARNPISRGKAFPSILGLVFKPNVNLHVH